MREKKRKERKENKTGGMASQKREKGWCENEWWGIVGLGGVHVVH